MPLYLSLVYHSSLERPKSMVYFSKVFFLPLLVPYVSVRHVLRPRWSQSFFILSVFILFCIHSNIYSQLGPCCESGLWYIDITWLFFMGGCSTSASDSCQSMVTVVKPGQITGTPQATDISLQLLFDHIINQPQDWCINVIRTLFMFPSYTCIYIHVYVYACSNTNALCQNCNELLSYMCRFRLVEISKKSLFYNRICYVLVD